MRMTAALAEIPAEIKSLRGIAVVAFWLVVVVWFVFAWLLAGVLVVGVAIAFKVLVVGCRGLVGGAGFRPVGPIVDQKLFILRGGG